MKKTASKDTKCSRNESILKIGHHAKAICKILTFGQKLKFQKTCQNPFYKSFAVVLCKKPLEKTLNIQKYWPLCQGYGKAKPAKLTYLVAEFRGSKIIQKINTHNRCFIEKKTQKTLSILEMTSF